MRKFSNKKLQNIILIALIIILVGVIFAIYIREKEEKNIASNENIEDLQLMKNKRNLKLNQ